MAGARLYLRLRMAHHSARLTPITRADARAPSRLIDDPADRAVARASESARTSLNGSGTGLLGLRLSMPLSGLAELEFAPTWADSEESSFARRSHGTSGRPSPPALSQRVGATPGHNQTGRPADHNRQPTTASKAEGLRKSQSGGQIVGLNGRVASPDSRDTLRTNGVPRRCFERFRLPGN